MLSNQPTTAQSTDKQVKGLIVDLSRRYGGASTRAILLAHGLADWHAAIAALEGSPVARAAQEQGIPVLTVGKSRGDPRIALRIAAAVREGGFQVLDTQNIQSQFWSSLATLLCKAALVSTLNSSYASEQGGNLKGRAYRMLERLSSPMTRRFIAVSRSIYEELCNAGVPAEKVDLIHNAVEVSAPESDGTRDRVRAALGIPDGAVLCTAVGRLVWAKGYADLIEAFAKVAEDLPQVYCVIVGDGVLRDELQQQINRAGLSKQVLLAGYRERAEALDILRGSDIFLMPSRSEGIPYALLEAGALGLPILATRCGGIPEVVRDEVEAVLVPPADVQALEAALKALCGNPEQRRQLGIAARQRITAEFSAEATIASTRKAYLKAAQQSRVMRR